MDHEQDVCPESNTWRYGVPLGTGGRCQLYALMAYTALFAAGLLTLAGAAAAALLRLIDERF